MSDRHVVTCDRYPCRAEEDAYCDGRRRSIDLPRGWTRDGSNDYCEDCSEEIAKAAAQAEEDAVTERIEAIASTYGGSGR